MEKLPSADIIMWTDGSVENSGNNAAIIIQQQNMYN